MTVLQSRIGGMTWENEPADHFDQYISYFERNHRGTLMPPTPGISEYNFFGAYDPNDGVVRYTIEPTYRPEFLNLLDYLRRENPMQIIHRSRLAAVACSPLRIPELMKKDVGREKYGKEILSHALSDRESDKLLDLVLRTTFKYMKVDMKYIARYLKDHESSSIGMGYKWPDLEVLDEEDWLQLRDALVEKLSTLMTYNRGKYYTKPYNVGIRSRSLQLPGMTPLRKYDGVVDRSRIVTFLFEFSSWNVFLPDKTAWYDEILTAVCRMFGVDRANLRFPVVEGGSVYVDFSDWLRDGKHFFAYDGKQFESAVGVILGYAFRGLMLYAHGEMEGSGISLTTLLNTIAMIRIYSRLVNGLLSIIMGDDLNVFSDVDRKPFKGEGFVEFQPEDTACQFNLGVAYAYDVRAPRLQGIKYTVDNGAKAIPYDFSDPGHVLIKGRHEERTTALWYGMHLGYFGKRTLIDAISGISGADFRGPGEMLQQLAVEGAKKMSMDEALHAVDSYNLI